MPENLPFLLPQSAGLSRSVTLRRQYRLQMLQIETFPNDAGPLSQSVTSKSIFAELLLQIETNRREHLLFVKAHEGVHELPPLRWLVW